jgi:hypothetical protein
MIPIYSHPSPVIYRYTLYTGTYDVCVSQGDARGAVEHVWIDQAGAYSLPLYRLAGLYAVSERASVSSLCEI